MNINFNMDIDLNAWAEAIGYRIFGDTQERQVITLLLRSSCFPLMRACGLKPKRYLKGTVLFTRLLKSLRGYK